MDILNQNVKYLKGVGPNRAQLLLKELQVETVRDLLYNFPYKYIDRSVIHRISQLIDNMPYVQLQGQLLSIDMEGEGYKKRLKAVFTDGSGYVDLVWFNGTKVIEKKLTGIGTSQLVYVLANLGMLYLSVILNVLCVYILNKKKLPVVMYIQTCWLLLFPMSIVPYTDVYILPFISLALVAYALMLKK